MHPSVQRRRATAALAVAAGLTSVLAGALVPAAASAPPSSAGTSTASTSERPADWFVDPRTPAQRRAEIAVPRHPEDYRGKVRRTHATYRTHAGRLAVPEGDAHGHVLERGQALTLEMKGLFRGHTAVLTPDARHRLQRLAPSLVNASFLRCEGYADYAGVARTNHRLARSRAAAVCAALVAANGTEGSRTVGYGPTHPTVVGGAPGDRRLNRRVVVQMTASRPVTPPPLVGTAPGAPTGLTVVGDDGVLTTTFGLPATDDGSPVTSFELSYDGGQTWEAASLSGDAPWTVVRAGFENGTTYDVRVRAANQWGPGAQAAAEALVATVPDAPTQVHATLDGTAVSVSFTAPEFDGGTSVTEYQVQVDDGDWTPVTLLAGGTSFGLGDQPPGTHTYRVRAVNERGASPASDPSTVEIATVQPDAPTIDYFGYNSWYAAWVVMYYPGADNGATVTGWEASVDGGPWVAASGLTGAGEALFPCADGGCGWSYEKPVRFRAVTATGFSEPSQPFVHSMP